MSLKAPRSLKSRALQLLAQREQSRVELRRKLLAHAIKETSANASASGQTAAGAGAVVERRAAGQEGFERDARRDRPQSSDRPQCSDRPRSGERPQSGERAHSRERRVSRASRAGGEGCGETFGTAAANDVAASVGEDGSVEHPQDEPTGGFADSAGVRQGASGGLHRVPLPSGGGPAPPDPVADTATPVSAEVEDVDAETRVEAVLEWLDAHGLLSDARFAESRVNARVARHGNLRIRQELKQHGVSLDGPALRQLVETEMSRAWTVWERRFGRRPDSAAESARQARFLTARGFSADTVRSAMRRARESPGTAEASDPEGSPES